MLKASTLYQLKTLNNIKFRESIFLFFERKGFKMNFVEQWKKLCNIESLIEQNNFKLIHQKYYNEFE